MMKEVKGMFSLPLPPEGSFTMQLLLGISSVVSLVIHDPIFCSCWGVWFSVLRLGVVVVLQIYLDRFKTRLNIAQISESVPILHLLYVSSKYLGPLCKCHVFVLWIFFQKQHPTKLKTLNNCNKPNTDEEIERSLCGKVLLYFLASFLLSTFIGFHTPYRCPWGPMSKSCLNKGKNHQICLQMWFEIWMFLVK